MKYTYDTESRVCEFETVDEVKFFLFLLQNIEFKPNNYSKSETHSEQEHQFLKKQERLVNKLIQVTLKHLQAISKLKCIAPCHPTTENL
jgi:hypothetical protein